MLENIRTVLIHTTHPGNIGASARALKTMGLSDLTLVSPKDFPSQEAIARAANAQDILENAKVVPTLKEALSGSNLILGTSGRSRTLSLPILTPREAANIIMQGLQAGQEARQGMEKTEVRAVQSVQSVQQCEAQSKIALLFGNEQHGLLNEELEVCHYQIQIPTHPEYSSLNLASAVQIVSYEIFYAYCLINSSSFSDATFSSSADLGGSVDLPNFESLTEFYDTLEKVLLDIRFLDPNHPGQMMTRLKRLFSRAKIDKTELTLLRGMLGAIQRVIH